MDYRIKKNFSMLVILGIFLGIVMAFPVVGDNTDTDWASDDANNEIYPYTITDQVGIGTQNPTSILHVNGAVTFGGGNQLTVSLGIITVTHSFHSVLGTNFQSNTGLTTITAADSTGQIVYLGTSAINYPVTFKDGTGNLLLAGDFTLDGDGDFITLISVNSNWCELSRSNNG